MNDPDQHRNENGEPALEAVAEIADVGIDIASEGIVDTVVDGVTAVAEIAGELIGGVLDIG